MRYTTAGQLWNIIAPREFVDFSYTTSYEDGLLTCGKPPTCLWQILILQQLLGFAFDSDLVVVNIQKMVFSK